METRSTNSAAESQIKPLFPGNDTAHEGQRWVVLEFFWHNIWNLAGLCFGLVGTCACFGFTYWLSKQTAECPDWAIKCSVLPSVSFMLERRAMVQSIVTTIYGISLTMLAFAVSQLAEPTLWPALVKRSFTFGEIDDYVNTIRGSLSSAPKALWHARGVGHLLLLVAVVLFSIVQLADNIIVGHAFGMTNITTTFESVHTQGGNIGLSFTQTNPPGALPGAVADAIITYNLWASGQITEPLPNQRNFIMNRANLTAIGNFSARAVEWQKSVTCTAQPWDVIRVDADSGLLHVSTNVNSGRTLLRIQPMLAVWVDSIELKDANKALTRLMFAALNGTIEGGYNNKVPEGTNEYAHSFQDSTFERISTLACDITIELKDSSVCTYNDAQKCKSKEKLLTSLSTLGSPEGWIQGISAIAVWLAAAIQTYGVSVDGAQPMFQHPGSISGAGTDGSIPIPWTTIAFGYTSNWSQDLLNKFIDVGTGALAMSIPWYSKTYPHYDKVTLESELPVLRMESHRSFVLLVPPCLLILILFIIAAVSMYLHKAANLGTVQLGTVWEIVCNSQTYDIRQMVNNVRDGRTARDTMEKLQVRYDKAAEGYGGLVDESQEARFPGNGFPTREPAVTRPVNSARWKEQYTFWVKTTNQHSLAHPLSYLSLSDSSNYSLGR